MINIYDNGAIMLGTVKMVREEIEKEIKEDIDMCCVDANEILEDLKDLDDEGIVAINYDCGMGYYIDYWYKSDIVKRGGENE